MAIDDELLDPVTGLPITSRLTKEDNEKFMEARRRELMQRRKEALMIELELNSEPNPRFEDTRPDPRFRPAPEPRFKPRGPNYRFKPRGPQQIRQKFSGDVIKNPRIANNTYKAGE